uniref:Uncharacterized protein n=1 Tax=Prevotella sp. GTC17254 TaxID=3236794 RepID=A0AB33J359_9BACT
MKTAYKKPYETPVTEIISTDLSPVMYQTSIQQAGEDETGGEVDAKQGSFFFDEEDDWANPGFDAWGD